GAGRGPGGLRGLVDHVVAGLLGDLVGAVAVRGRDGDVVRPEHSRPAAGAGARLGAGVLRGGDAVLDRRVGLIEALVRGTVDLGGHGHGGVAGADDPVQQ